VRRFAALAFPDEARIDRAEGAQIGEAVCFFHPEKKAAISCQQCGRFICTLCDLPMGSRHLCPSCVEGGMTSEKVPEMVNRRFIWGGAALSLGWLPILFGSFLFLGYFATGPGAIITGIYAFKKPGSVVRGRRPVAAVFGILGGVIQLLLIGVLCYFFITFRR
jgi:hypothetical protein